VVLADEVVVEVVHSFQLKEGSMKIHHTMSEDFLLLLPDAVAVEWVYASCRAFHVTPIFSNSMFQIKLEIAFDN
jgi:hypothetical protein